MATPDTLAKTAREKLAQALNALQTAPDAPVFVLELAEPIAQSMALLHKIERSRGSDLSGKDIVAANVRLVLDKLQAATESHATIDQLMECVAGSLASVHQLARSTPVAAAAPAPSAPAAPAPSAPAAPRPAPTPVAAAPQAGAGVSASGTHILSPQQGQQVMQAAHAAIAQNAAPPGFPAPPAFAAAAPGVPTSQPAFAAAQPAAPAQAPRASNQTVRMDQSPVAVQQAAAQQAAAQQAAAQQQHQQAAAQHHAPAPQAARPIAAAAPIAQAPAVARPAPASAPSQPGGNVLVELGAHSNSNFYKGLGGNDVIEHGGLFVATYKIPKLGMQVNLRVLLPGDYEFQATGVVQWIREPQGGEVDPGFGARLTQITPEGRQLVYRYTRNREPMFYDDL